MKRREFHLGPGAASLMLVAVVLAMSLLGTLSLMNARGDLHMARRRVDIAVSAAELDAAGEASFAQLDAMLAECAAQAENNEDYLARVEEMLPVEYELVDGLISWTETGAESRCLECAVRIAPLGEEVRLSWEIHRHWADIEGDYFL